MLECPICKQEFKSLISHLVMKHNLSKEEIKDKFAHIKLHEDNRDKNKNLTCKHCNHTFKTQNALSSHIKYKYPEKYQKHVNIKKAEEMIECLICRKQLQANLPQHLKIVHNLAFDEYASKYNYSGPKTIFSKEHISDSVLYSDVKSMLDKEACTITQVFTNRNAKPRIIERSDSNWQNNKNIKVVYKGDKLCKN